MIQFYKKVSDDSFGMTLIGFMLFIFVEWIYLEKGSVWNNLSRGIGVGPEG